MNLILNKILRIKKQNKFITIVSGLPRSGTSMMMQMLEAGGMQIATDHIRKPDEDNPKGYYEFEKVKKIKKDTSWIDNCYGKAFKMVSMLLYDLPADKIYKVIFMKRNMEEILKSQKVMLERLGKIQSNISDDEMADKYKKHLQELKYWLVKQSHIDLIYINYIDVIRNPPDIAKNVNQFLGNWLNVDEMIRVLDKSLYRQRKK